MIQEPGLLRAGEDEMLNDLTKLKIIESGIERWLM